MLIGWVARQRHNDRVGGDSESAAVLGDAKMRRRLALVIGLSAWRGVAAADSAITIERLLEDGWDIAGYAGTFDNRSSLMLFRHKDKKYLVQCSVLYDVTRNPRTNVNCYELR